VASRATGVQWMTTFEVVKLHLNRIFGGARGQSASLRTVRKPKYIVHYLMDE